MQTFHLVASGSRNSAFGYNALKDISTGRGNTGVGQFAIPILTDGEFNTGVGNNCLTLLTEGDNNTAFGLNSGGSLTIGNNNTMIGSETDCSAELDNQIAIGYQAVTTLANQCIIGNANLDEISNIGDGVCDLGAPTRQFKDIYSAGVIYGNNLFYRQTNPLLRDTDEEIVSVRDTFLLLYSRIESLTTTVNELLTIISVNNIDNTLEINRPFKVL